MLVWVIQKHNYEVFIVFLDHFLTIDFLYLQLDHKGLEKVLVQNYSQAVDSAGNPNIRWAFFPVYITSSAFYQSLLT